MNYRNKFLEIRKQAITLSCLKDSERRKILLKMSGSILKAEKNIMIANHKDLKLLKGKGATKAFIDRLTLNKKRIYEMAKQIKTVANLTSPIGKTLELRKRPNGLLIKKVSVPIGTIFVIYEARPNVTSDCAALCFKSGNAVILRGGSNALNSNRAIYSAIRKSLPASVKDTVFFIDDTSRKTVSTILQMKDYIDAVIPRGGESLIKTVVENSKIPVIYHGKEYVIYT